MSYITNELKNRYQNDVMFHKVVDAIYAFTKQENYSDIDIYDMYRILIELYAFNKNRLDVIQ